MRKYFDIQEEHTHTIGVRPLSSGSLTCDAIILPFTKVEF